MPSRLRYIGRVISLFFRLFIVRSAKVMFLPKSGPKGAPVPPPVIKRLENRPQMVAGALLVFLFFLLNLLYFLHVDPVQHAHYAVYIVGGVFVICFLILPWSRKEIVVLLREAGANDCRLCLHCGYNLKGLPAQHRCPECGSPYEIEQVKRTWSEYLADRAAGHTLL
ncbi:MAG TPA: hypothetical protein PLL20_00725 [Phycisphaerae bacterium]|nr:hypothetical protein [Phycisphaerae bacterium]HRR85952.1 hypothetical protein [Phycisphaerae bacterium]